MMVGVNAAIGQSICMDSPDILVASSSAAMFHQGNMVGCLLFTRLQCLNSNSLILKQYDTELPYSIQ